MRKILNYLLGEDLVSEQEDQEIRKAITGAAMCWIVLALGFFVLYVCG